MSHLIFNLRRICRAALPHLLFFSLQWNCWTLFVDLNFPVHAGIHARVEGNRAWWISPVGAALTKRRIIFPKRRKMEKNRGTRARGKKTTIAAEWNFLSVAILSTLLPAVFLQLFLFFIPLLTESNSRIWIYYLLSSCVTYWICFDQKCFLNATLLAISLHINCFFII